MKKAILACLVYCFCQAVAISQSIIRGPYLQQPTETSIVLRWRTSVPATSKVVFGTSKNQLNLSQNIDSEVTEHIVKLSNLAVETKYYYQIWAGAKLISSSENNFFKTAPGINSEKPIHILAGGDFADFSQEYYKVNQTQVRDAYLNYSKNFDTDFWFWLGDAGYGDNRDVKLQESIFDFYGPSIMNHVPFSAALGNHEFDGNNAVTQKTREVHLLEITSPPTQAEAGGIASNTKAFYSFNYGNTHFINLDSYGMDDGLYRVYDSQGAQNQWLIKDLEANKSLWTVVFFHHPPYTKRNHDSDIEEELRLIREKLVPIFDKYKVDLVLNGHSHIYERSYLMQDHLGQTPFFDPTYHIVDKSSGKYQKNEPPFINKTKGTVYVVAGSFGRLEPQSAFLVGYPAHPASVYSNLVNGGSLALKIETNRLDLEWVCADGVIRDRFTMFKNVNKTQRINLAYGQSAKLKASWPGSYVWSNGETNKREIEVQPLLSTNFSVKDSLGFLTDNFEIIVAARPKISPQITSTGVICNGKTLTGKLNLENANFEIEYKILLSDENGLFERPTVIETLGTQDFALKIPENALPSNNYKLKIEPISADFEGTTIDNISIKNSAKGSILNEPNLPYSKELILKIKLSGSFPIDYKLDFQDKQTTSQTDIEFKINPIGAKTYILESVSNECGIGIVSNSIIAVAAKPKLSPEITSTQTLCNGKNIVGKLNLTDTDFNQWQFKIQLSEHTGLFEKPIIDQTLTSQQFSIKIPENAIEGNNYKLRVLANSDIFESSIIENIKISKTATAQFLNQPIVPFTEKITLKIDLSGTFPIEYKLNFLPIQTSNLKLIEVEVNQKEGKNYILETVKNTCGEGQITNGKITIEAPLGNELMKFGVSIFPNPAEDNLTIVSENMDKLFGEIINLSGVKMKTLKINKGLNQIDLSNLLSGIYILEIKNKKGEVANLKFLKR